MLNKNTKEQAIQDLKNADSAYTVIFKKTVHDMERLQSTRVLAIRSIQYVEGYVIRLANRPRDIDKKIGDIRVRYVKFQDDCKKIERKQVELEKTGGYGLAGALGGAGMAAFGPTAAMSIAMTFGTASTGTAIASLSGAAATNAALAWLGGGALAAGGTGMAAGQTVLALAGPIGWAIGGISLGASLLAINMKNTEITQKTENSVKSIKKETERIKEIGVQVNSWNEETKKLSNKIMSSLNRIKANRKLDFCDFSDDELNDLVSLLNSTEVLSKKIGQTINE